jgi:outer membrane murein-binding lipoprotein Lpp
MPDPDFIDRLLVWVQHPAALLVALVLVVGLLLRREWLREQRIRAELAECWALHEQGQKEILDLTAFLVEAITLAGTSPRSKDHAEQVGDLKSRIGQFQHDKELAYARHKAEREARARR